MRDHLLFSVNGKPQRVYGAEVFSTLSTHLRERLRLTGTKVVCAEGDCGACSVLVAREPPDTSPAPSATLTWQPVDACIVFLHQLDGCHVTTVEGLAPDGQTLHPVQRAMIDHFGSQCGYCTPGFVVTLAGLADDARRRGEATIDSHRARRGLTGNLCRCTGYLQILEAAAAIETGACPDPGDRLPAPTRAALAAAARDAVLVTTDSGHTLSIPTTIEQAVALLERRPETRIVAGATDLGVQHNKGALEPASVLQLGPRIPGFDVLEIDGRLAEDDRLARDGGTLRAGAGVTWSALLEATRERVPELAAILERFGAPQIRHLGTVGGNLANASPIADSLPFFFVLGASLELVGPGGRRRVGIEDFYRGYKDLDLGPGELIAAIECPLPEAGQLLRLRKLSRRRDLDISSVTAAFLLTLDGRRVADARIAFGGVGPVVLRTPRAEELLRGRELDPDLARRAGRVAREEIAPITDVRGSEEYRGRLVENLFLELAHELHAPARAAGG